MRVRSRQGFTLVELLVVIAIIGVLISLLLPAVHAARDMARRATCSHNLKQLALACLEHEEAHGFLPSGGWGYRWIGDPKRGVGRGQPGGWAYSILPFLEQEPLHDVGFYETGAARQEALAKVVATPLKIFNCPSRRHFKAYRCRASYVELDSVLIKEAGRSDYAACAGSELPPPCEESADGLSIGDLCGPPSLDNIANYSWNRIDQNGVIYQRSQTTFKTIPDGASSTYLIGERFADPDHYTDGEDPGDNQCLYAGHGNDTLRWASDSPLQDISDPYDNHVFKFGSVHRSVFNMALCDGSVHQIFYSIDLTTHRQLADRADHASVNIDDL